MKLFPIATLALVLFAVSACKTSKKSVKETLKREAEINSHLFKREWTLVSLSRVGKGDLEQLGDAKPILMIGETISGYTGCNRLMGGTYELKGERILISNLASTKKMCVGVGQKVETELLAVLNNAKTYKMEGVKLTLFTADNRTAEFIALDKE